MYVKPRQDHTEDQGQVNARRLRQAVSALAAPREWRQRSSIHTFPHLARGRAMTAMGWKPRTPTRNGDTGIVRPRPCYGSIYGVSAERRVAAR